MTFTETGAYAPTLVVTGGPHDGKKLVCPPSVTKVLGSGPACPLGLEGANVDAEHARVVWEMRGLLLIDQGSHAGTFVNGERVEFERTLSEGDRISLGPPGSRQSVKLLVRMAPDVAVAAGAERAPGAPEPTLVFDESPLLLDAEPEGAGGTLTLPRGQAPALFEDAFTGPGSTPTLLGDAQPTLLAADAPTLLEADAAPEALAASEEALVLVDVDPEVEEDAPTTPRLTAPPPPEPPSPAIRPAPPPPPTPPPRKPARPDYSSALPSIEVPEPRGESAAPAPPARVAQSPKVTPVSKPAPSAARASRLPSVSLPRPVMLGGLAAVLALGAWFVSSRFSAHPPAVLSVLPPKVEPGGTVTLTGTGFGNDPARVSVRFGDQSAQVLSAADTRLSVAVPKLDVSQGARSLPVSVDVRGARAGGLFVKVVMLPKVGALVPEVALPGTEVTAQGRNLGAKSAVVMVGGVKAEVLEARTERLRFRVPEMPVILGKAVPVIVSVTGESATAPDLVLGRLPLLLALDPPGGPAGTRVLLRGRGFGAQPSENQVTFSGRRALVLAATPRELTVAAPGLRAPEAQVQVPVAVTAAGATSNPQDYTLYNPTSNTFTPRFFAAESELPGQALVSSVIAPLLVLGDRGQSASLPERAVTTADALNALIDAWTAGGAAPLQVRDAPQASVWAPGQAKPLLSVFPGDLAAYARRGRGVGGGARGLAAFWAALVGDYLTLFVQGQRPSASAVLSARGRVLLDIYSEISRRGRTGPGVPRSLVLAPTPALEAGLRDLALDPGGGSRTATASAPIEGVWEGRADDDSGRRQLQVSLRSVGGRLQGEATARSRALGMSVPLSDVSFTAGTLRFTLLAGGVPRQFVGTLQGSQVVGKIHVPGRKEPVGSFALDFVQ